MNRDVRTQQSISNSVFGTLPRASKRGEPDILGIGFGGGASAGIPDLFGFGGSTAGRRSGGEFGVTDPMALIFGAGASRPPQKKKTPANDRKKPTAKPKTSARRPVASPKKPVASKPRKQTKQVAPIKKKASAAVKPVRKPAGKRQTTSKKKQGSKKR